MRIHTFKEFGFESDAYLEIPVDYSDFGQRLRHALNFIFKKDNSKCVLAEIVIRGDKEQLIKVLEKLNKYNIPEDNKCDLTNSTLFFREENIELQMRHEKVKTLVGKKFLSKGEITFTFCLYRRLMSRFIRRLKHGMKYLFKRNLNSRIISLKLDQEDIRAILELTF
jgi:hypothetical protein